MSESGKQFDFNQFLSSMKMQKDQAEAPADPAAANPFASPTGRIPSPSVDAPTARLQRDEPPTGLSPVRPGGRAETQEAGRLIPAPTPATPPGPTPSGPPLQSMPRMQAPPPDSSKNAGPAPTPAPSHALLAGPAKPLPPANRVPLPAPVPAATPPAPAETAWEPPTTPAVTTQPPPQGYDGGWDYGSTPQANAWEAHPQAQAWEQQPEPQQAQQQGWEGGNNWSQPGTEWPQQQEWQQQPTAAAGEWQGQSQEWQGGQWPAENGQEGWGHPQQQGWDPNAQGQEGWQGDPQQWDPEQQQWAAQQHGGWEQPGSAWAAGGEQAWQQPAGQWEGHAANQWEGQANQWEQQPASQTQWPEPAPPPPPAEPQAPAHWAAPETRIPPQGNPPPPTAPPAAMAPPAGIASPTVIPPPQVAPKPEPAPAPPTPVARPAMVAPPKPAARPATTGLRELPPEALDKPVRPNMTLRGLLENMVSVGASDLHLSAGVPPCLRLQGDIQPQPFDPLTPEEIEALLFPVLNEKQHETFTTTNDVDFAMELTGLARFRVNFARQYRGMYAVMRIIPKDIPNLAQLNLPPAIEKLCRIRRGLIIVTGPTGSGKSTTLAAMINEINQVRQAHIITIEDPIEFVHVSKKCLISHREIGQHASSFADAIRAAVREDPDIVLVGEMRDLDTVSQAVRAAEMGLLVLATLHTNNASKAVDRIVDIFPAEDQEQIRVTLSEALKGVVAQQLLKRADGKGRVATHEILIGTPALSNLIRDAKTHQIPGVIQTGRGDGMQLMDQGLIDLIQKGVITPQQAREKATDLRNFQRAGINLD